MKKYRVIEKNNKFYPQSRHFFIWYGFEENGRTAWRTTLQGAKDAITEFIKEQKTVIYEYP